MRIFWRPVYLYPANLLNRLYSSCSFWLTLTSLLIMLYYFCWNVKFLMIICACLRICGIAKHVLIHACKLVSRTLVYGIGLDNLSDGMGCICLFFFCLFLLFWIDLCLRRERNPFNMCFAWLYCGCSFSCKFADGNKTAVYQWIYILSSVWWWVYF